VTSGPEQLGFGYDNLCDNLRIAAATMKLIEKLADTANNEPQAIFAGIGAVLFGLGGLISDAIEGLHQGGYIGAVLYGLGLGILGAIGGALIGFLLFYVLALALLALLIKGIIWAVHSLWGIGRP
jgi:hypothetical protein